MNIPGLGQLPKEEVAPSAQRSFNLPPLAQYRFQTAPPGLTIRLTSGTAEKDGTELALNKTYTFLSARAVIATWQGCTLEIEGTVLSETISTPNESNPPALVAHFNLHHYLSAHRTAAAGHGAGGPPGPRVLVCGTRSSGRTTLVRSLAAWATRAGEAPIVVNADPREGMLSLPGTLSAAVFATVMDVESEGGWGGAPTSGPSAVPVKLPLVYYHGHDKVEEDESLYRQLVGKLAAGVTGRMSGDEAVRSSGLLIDGPAVGGRGSVDVLAHIVEEFSVNIVVVLGSAKLEQELTRRFASTQTSLNEEISVVLLDKAEGVINRDDDFMQASREAIIREYFFGDSKRSLSPYTQQVDFNAVTVYKSPSPEEYFSADDSMEKLQPDSSLSHWTLAVMNAALNDPPETIRTAPVLGFVYIADVDEKREKLKVLAPLSGRLGDNPMIRGRWPEPYLNLLG